MPVDRGNETPERRTARHLSEIKFDAPMGGKFVAVPAEGYFITTTHVRLDPRRVTDDDFMGSIALDGGNLPLRMDSQATLDAFRAELVSKGIVDEKNRENVRIIVDRKEEGQSQFATLGKLAKVGQLGGAHVESTLVIPIEDVDVNKAQEWALKSRAMRKSQHVGKAVDEFLGKVKMDDAVAALAARDPEAFREAVMALVLADPKIRKEITEVVGQVNEASAAAKPDSGTIKERGGWRTNFGDRPRGPNEVE